MTEQRDDKAQEASENAEIRTLLRQRFLELLRDPDRTLRGSTLAQIVSYLKSLEDIRAKPTPEEEAEQAMQSVTKKLAGKLPFPTDDEDDSPNPWRRPLGLNEDGE